MTAADPFDLPPSGFLAGRALFAKTLKPELKDAAIRFGVALPRPALALVDELRVTLGRMTTTVVPHADDAAPYQDDDLDTVRRVILDHGGDPLLSRMCSELAGAVGCPRELEGARQFVSVVAEVLAGRVAIERPAANAFVDAADEMQVTWSAKKEP